MTTYLEITQLLEFGILPITFFLPLKFRKSLPEMVCT